MFSIFKRNQQPAPAPTTIPAQAPVRSSQHVTLDDVQGWENLFQTWFKEDAGKGVTPERAMTASPVFCAVMFLSRTMAALPKQAFKTTSGKTKKITSGAVPALLALSPNGEITAFDFWQYVWQSMWSRGAGRAWVERDRSGKPVALWPLEFKRTTPKRKGFKKVYEYRDHNRTITYPAADVIDLSFAFEDDGLTPMHPISKCRGSIGLYLNLQNYANSFFKNGGVPPLTLEGPMASGAEAVRRSAKDVELSIQQANENDNNVLPIPTGFKLSPVAFDPSKGQMTSAKKAQVIEIAQAFQLGPAFLHDLSNGTFNNIEQQDLNLVKHLILHFAVKADQEVGLKLFGTKPRGQFIKHNLDGLMRGDFKSRIEAYARAINTAQITPNEVRKLEDRPEVDTPEADKLHIQGATVVIDAPRAVKSEPVEPPKGDANDE